MKLGGSYDPATKKFTFYTDRFSLYSVVKANQLTNISLTLNNPAAIVNGAAKTLDTQPVFIYNRTMVPVRFIAESLGAVVNWLNASRTVEIKLDGQVITLVLDQTGPSLDVLATIVNSRTMVPIRYVSENLGAYVKWFPSTSKVEIVK